MSKLRNPLVGLAAAVAALIAVLVINGRAEAAEAAAHTYGALR